jgi:hypothetical protein
LLAVRDEVGTFFYQGIVSYGPIQGLYTEDTDMMRLTTVKVKKVIIVPLVPSREECLKHLAHEIDIPIEQIGIVINESIPLLKIHNRRAANIIIWHYGLNGRNPMSVEKICRRYKVGKTRLREMHRGAVKFLDTVHWPPQHRFVAPQIYGMHVYDFFAPRRIMENLHDRAPSKRYQEANRLGWVLHSKFRQYETLGRMITWLKQQPRETIRRQLQPRAFVMLERLLATLDMHLVEAVNAESKQNKRA